MNVLRFKKHLQVHYYNIYVHATYIHHFKGGEMENVAVKSLYDEILHNKIYLRIKKNLKGTVVLVNCIENS